jgi:hypothetical protein
MYEPLHAFLPRKILGCQASEVTIVARIAAIVAMASAVYFF